MDTIATSSLGWWLLIEELIFFGLWACLMSYVYCARNKLAHRPQWIAALILFVLLGLLAFSPSQLQLPYIDYRVIRLGGQIILGLFIGYYLYKLWRLASVKRVIVLGVKGIPERKLRQILPSDHPGYDIIGIVDDDSSLLGCRVAGLPVLGTSSQLLSLTQARAIDLIVVTMEQRRGCFPIQVLLNCRNKGIQILDWPQFYEQAWGRLMPAHQRLSSLLFGPGFKNRKADQLIKRAVELIGTGLLLAILFPVGLLAAIYLHRLPRWKVLEKTPCIGQHEIIFDRLTFACPDTPLGRLMQRLGIVHWPVLINIIRGQMNWVGVTGYDPIHMDQLQKYPMFYRRLSELKPGVFSWADVKTAQRHIPEFREQFEYDLYYLKHHSLWLDIKILLKEIALLFQPGFTVISDYKYKEVSYYGEIEHQGYSR